VEIWGFSNMLNIGEMGGALFDFCVNVLGMNGMVWHGLVEDLTVTLIKTETNILTLALCLKRKGGMERGILEFWYHLGSCRG
jgi:hypothetical protein